MSIYCYVLVISCDGNVKSQFENPVIKKSESELKNPKEDKPTVIKEKSIGLVRLGDDFEKVVSMLPFKKGYDTIHENTEITTPDKIIKCSKEYHWISLNEENVEQFFIYFENDVVFQIEAVTQKYKLDDKIGKNYSVEEVKKHYPNIETYTLTNSGASKQSEEDLIYLVDKNNGIALEFRFSKSQKKRLIYKLILFKPNSLFQPKTCVTPPQKFEKTTTNIDIQ